MKTPPQKPAPKKAPAKAAAPKPPAAPPPRQPLYIREGLTIADVAERMAMKPRELIEKLAAAGYAADPGDMADPALAGVVTKALPFDAEFVTLEQEMRRLAESRPGELVPRPPVVTIMGHVDHGKTTLLDAIRSSHLVDKESGGITQHIGAYRVVTRNRPITFVDTPGHEAFTQLRARGAQVTDIVVLVIAADDGIMPQTKEAIDHARAANAPIIVAINKIDRPEANVERVKQQLSRENLLVEEWGGKTIAVEVSAKEKKNIDDLLEMILLLGDIIELKGNPTVPAQGVILEARLDAQRGPVGTVIIRQGALSVGQAFVAGTAYGKVRAAFDEAGRPVKNAGLSVPVEILGFSEVPQAGTPFQVVGDLPEARRIAEFRGAGVRKEDAPSRPEYVSLDELFKKIETGRAKELALVVKGDVQGSVEVLQELLPTLATEKVKIRIIHAATGAITEADVLLAAASKAIVLGYNVKPNPKIADLARLENVEIRTYRIIYQLIDEIKKAVIGLLEPVIKETYLGRAEIRRVFQIPRTGSIAGCYVVDGRIARNAEIRVLRGKEVLHEGRISSLKHVKENVTEIKKDYECGIGLEKFHDFQAGDVIEAFVREKVKPTA